jgi:antitoxin (DNA-binding transcriptional repressor) of toxin-antitoxin stability system
MSYMGSKRKTISVTEFRKTGLRILHELGPNGIVITKRGCPVARLMPMEFVDNSHLIGSMKGKIVVKGNIYSAVRNWRRHSVPILTRPKGVRSVKSRFP